MQNKFEDDISVILRVRDEERWIGHTIQSCVDFIKNLRSLLDNNSKDQR